MRGDHSTKVMVKILWGMWEIRTICNIITISVKWVINSRKGTTT